MIVATLGFGQHYLFDLVVAVPYAMAVHKIGTGFGLNAVSDRRLTSAGALACHNPQISMP